jgi:hypothetical protein
MNDDRMDEILRAFAGGRCVPSGRLIMRTKAAIRGRRLLQVAIVSSICMQLIAMAIVVLLLALPGVSVEARICGGIALFGYAGCVVVAAVAARRTVVRFFAQVERLMV